MKLADKMQPTVKWAYVLAFYEVIIILVDSQKAVGIRITLVLLYCLYIIIYNKSATKSKQQAVYFVKFILNFKWLNHRMHIISYIHRLSMLSSSFYFDNPKHTMLNFKYMVCCQDFNNQATVGCATTVLQVCIICRIGRTRKYMNVPRQVRLMNVESYAK